ncbi:hypothetical protein [Pedobacter heparinus]|uniref:hypothetical protein n=1 Tax=Pedobacter heparinus TaxID=984 RepID=UPI00292F4B5D|nr:hypothetical protein [Pedobacter heparinus]
MTRAQPKSVVVPEKIFISSINITNAQVNTAQGIASNSWDKMEYQVKTKSQFSRNTNDCKIVLSTDFRKNDENREPIISANFTIEFVFIIENLDEFRFVDEKKNENEEPTIKIHKDLGIALMSIVYSTARGIILTRTAGTVLDGAILPVIDPASILS